MIENEEIFIEEDWEIIDKNYKKGSYGKIIKGKKKNGIINKTNVKDKMIAIKEISKEKERKRYNEADILEIIKKENKGVKIKTIIDYYGYGIKGDKLYIYLEFIEGETIYELKKNGYEFNETQISIILNRCLETMKFLHQNCKLVHMDLKCDNIIIKRDKNEIDENKLDLKIIDYGLTQQIGETKRDKSGTFLSKEVVCGVASLVDYKFDVYSLGCMSIELSIPNQFKMESGHAILDFLKNDKIKFSPLFLNFIKKCLYTNLDVNALEIHPFITGNCKEVGNYINILKVTQLKKKKDQLKIGDQTSDVTNQSIIGSCNNDKRMIEFGEDFNQTIEENLLKDKRIVIIKNSNFNINFNYIFTGVEYLSIKGIGILNLEKCVPLCLETFIYEGEFNGVINYNDFGNKLKHLILKNYKNKINRGAIPEGVTFLELSNSIQLSEIITFKNLPASIDELCFGCSQETLKQIKREHIQPKINFLFINGNLMKFSDNNILIDYN
ncbi:hypothetical protein ACTA71_011700 [Dictyostelium dimigraforme]